jgi:hypothetical protein
MFTTSDIRKEFDINATPYWKKWDIFELCLAHMIFNKENPTCLTSSLWARQSLICGILFVEKIW